MYLSPDNENDNDSEFIFQFIQITYMNTIYKYIYE